MKKIIGATLIGVSLIGLTGCNTLNMFAKNLESNYGNMPRTVTVYDIKGNKIKEYSGEVFISDAKGNTWELLVNNKKVNIVTATGTIIAEEENK